MLHNWHLVNIRFLVDSRQFFSPSTPSSRHVADGIEFFGEWLTLLWILGPCWRVCARIVCGCGFAFSWHCLNGYWCCHIWLLHIKCVLMRDDIALFISSRTSVTVFLCQHCVCLLPIFLFFGVFIFSSFFLILIPVSFDCIVCVCVRVVWWCSSMRCDDKTIWIMFIQLELDLLFFIFFSFVFFQMSDFYVCNVMFEQAYLLGFPILHRMSFDQSQTILSSLFLRKEMLNVCVLIHFQSVQFSSTVIFVVGYCLSTNI